MNESSWLNFYPTFLSLLFITSWEGELDKILIVFTTNEFYNSSSTWPHFFMGLWQQSYHKKSNIKLKLLPVQGLQNLFQDRYFLLLFDDHVAVHLIGYGISQNKRLCFLPHSRQHWENTHDSQSILQYYRKPP